MSNSRALLAVRLLPAMNTELGITGTMPSAEALAALSDRSARILFDRFETLDCLAAEACQQIFSSHDLVLPTQLLLHDFEDRLDWYVRSRAETCEAWRHMWPMMVQFTRKDTRCAAWASGRITIRSMLK